MIISIGDNEYVSGQAYTVENVRAAYIQGLRNGKWEAEQEIKIIKHNAYQDGRAQAYSELNEKLIITKQLQEKAWDEGYVSAIEDYLTQGEEFVSNKGCYEFRYEAGAEQFIKENMDNIKSYTRVGDVVSIELYDIDCEHTPNKETQEAMQEVLDKDNRKHSHYFKDTSKFDEIDTYLLARIWGIEDKNGAYFHAFKKVLDAGKRGNKGKLKDIGEAIDSLKRYIEVEEMFEEYKHD